MTTVFVDLEGTLSNHDDRRDALLVATRNDPRNRESWKTYYAGLPDDDPRDDVLYAVKRWIQEGYRVIVYSTRFINKYCHEEEWLRGHELYDHVELWQREQYQTKIKGPDLVVEWVQELKPSIVVDDREEVRDKVSAISDAVVLGPKDFP